MKIKIEKDLLVFLLVQLLVLLAFYLPWLSSSSSYFFRDLTHYIEPFARFTGESMRQLRFPLWNPWNYCGMPQMSISVQGICYPPTWIFAVLPFSSGLAANMILHQMICGLGGFLSVKSLGWGKWPATICGMTLSMSGYAFCFTSIFSLVQSSAWCPISIWALYELSKCCAARPPATQLARAGREEEQSARKPAYWIAVASILLALQLVAGHPELSSVHFLFVGAFILFLFLKRWKDSRQEAKQVLFWQGKAVVLSILLALPAILPALEWLPLSRRAGGLDPSESLILSATGYDLLGLVLAQPLGDMQLRFSEFRALVMNGQLLPYMASAFVGPVLVTLAVWSLADSKWKERWLLLGLLVLVLLLALGANTPFLPILMKVVKLPIRFPVKLMFFAVWGISFMAARGLFICSQRDGKPYLLSAVFWILFAIAGAMFLSGAIPLNAAVAPQLIQAAESRLGVACLLGSLLGLALSLLCWFSYKKEQLNKFSGQVIVAAAAITLIVNACWFCRCPGAANFFEKTSVVAEQLKKLRQSNSEAGRVLDLFFEHFTVPQAYLQGRNNLEATESMYQYSRQALRSNTNIDFGEASSFGFEGTCTGEFFYFLTNSYGKSSQARQSKPSQADDLSLARFCQASATRFLITQVYRYADRPDKLEAIQVLNKAYFQLAFEDVESNLRIYEVKEPLPRAYFSDAWDWVSHEEALTKAFDPSASGFDPTKLTLLEAEPKPEENAIPGTIHLKDNPVRIVEDKVNELQIEVRAKRDGYLILSDQDYPGWHTELDGRSCEILRANCFYRAVAVPEGQHKVNFVYRPYSFFSGLALSFLAALLLLIDLLKGRKNSRHEDKS